MKPCASSHETCSTGQRPQPENFEGFVPITACHWPCVTSCLPSQYPRLIRTRVTGCSLSNASELVEPIRNSPAGTHTNSIPSNARDSPARGCGAPETHLGADHLNRSRTGAAGSAGTN